MPIMNPAWTVKDYATTMARYNQWMNDKIYAAAGTLSDVQRKADLGAFFRSIHGTLNHVLVVDEAWLQRLRGEAVTMRAPDEIRHDDFEVLRRQRAALDDELGKWADTLDGTIPPDRPFTFESVAYQRQVTLPLVAVVMHLFNHQTHHRGQITALLSRLHADVGVTDLPLMPGLG